MFISLIQYQQIYILVPIERALEVGSHGGIFQMMFLMVTEEHLILNLKRSSICRIIIICIMGSWVFLLKFFPPYLNSWQLPCYCMSVLVLSTTLSVFGGMFHGLITAGTSLNKCFKVRQSCI
jgi:hypothetical protein